MRHITISGRGPCGASRPLAAGVKTVSLIRIRACGAGAAGLAQGAAGARPRGGAPLPRPAWPDARQPRCADAQAIMLRHALASPRPPPAACARRYAWGCTGIRSTRARPDPRTRKDWRPDLRSLHPAPRSFRTRPPFHARQHRLIPMWRLKRAVPNRSNQMISQSGSYCAACRPARAALVRGERAAGGWVEVSAYHRTVRTGLDPPALPALL